MALSLHPDKAVAQINSASKEIYLVFFLFPDAAIAAKTSSEESGQPDMQKASVAIQNDLDAAQKAAAASQWDQALEYLKTAGEEEGRSVRDAKMILETQGSIYAEMRRNTEAQASYEKALRFATLISTADTLEVSRRLLNLLSPSQQPLKSIELGRNLAEHGVATAADMAVISRSYFALKDCKYTTQWADKSIQAAESAGESSDSMLYELKAECDRAPFPFGGF
jgi:tetratricopeptide (TPR) repeat protein